MEQTYNLSQYLLLRLKEIGLKHMFTVPGDYLLTFLDEVVASDIKLVTCCNELNAGYAADGYSRCNGIGALAITYGVGELSALNAVMGAYAERVPLVVISGAPALPHHYSGKLLHHTMGDYAVTKQMYQKVTVAAELIADPLRAPEQIDRVLYECLYHKRPVYIEIPADMVKQGHFEMKPFVFPKFESDGAVLKEAVEEAAQMLEEASNPVVLLGLEIVRFHLRHEVEKLIDKQGYPYATFLLGKTALSEDNPNFLGLYQGAWSQPAVQKRVENADCILILGAFMTDLDTGGFSAKLEHHKVIRASAKQVKIKNHHYDHVNLQDFIVKLTNHLPKKSHTFVQSHPLHERFVHHTLEPFSPDSQAKLTLQRFYDRIAHFIHPNDILLADVGTALFNLSQLLFPENATFIGQSFYSSIGYTVGAALGVALAEPKRRTLVFVGDGAFQLTCQELSTLMYMDCKPIIFLINNEGYTIERIIHDGPYNDIRSWKYHLLPQVFGNGWGCEVFNEGELEKALQHAERSDVLSLIEIHVDKWDCSASLSELGKGLSKPTHRS